MSIIDLFRPKWKHSNPNIRKKALLGIENQERITDIAKNDQSIEVRKAAIIKITDEFALAEIVKKESESVIYQVALSHIENQEILLDICETAYSDLVRYAAVEHLNSEEALAALIKNSQNLPLRLKAIDRLKNQSLLMELFTTDNEPQIRQKALLVLNEEQMFLKAALNDPDSEIRRFSLDKISSNEKILKLILESSYSDTSVAALNKIDKTNIAILETLLNETNDQGVIQNIIVSSIPKHLRDIAFERITDQADIGKIILNNNDENICSAGLEKVYDNIVLRDIVQNAKPRRIRLKAIRKMSDQHFIERLLKTEKDIGIIHEAVCLLEDQKSIEKIAENTRMAIWIRLAAIRKINETPCLVRLINLAGKAKKKIRIASVLQLNDDFELEKVVRSKAAFAIRELALNRITDSDILFNIALSDIDESLKKDAYRLIRDSDTAIRLVKANPELRYHGFNEFLSQEIYSDIAKNSSSSFLREWATRRIFDEGLLEDLAKNASDQSVRNLATYTLRNLEDIIFVAKKGFKDKVLSLIQAGVDVNKTGKFGTALHAVIDGASTREDICSQIIETLISAGADIEARDNLGRSPLGAALDGMKIKCALVLISNGADVFKVDDDKNSMLCKMASWFFDPEEDGYEDNLNFMENLLEAGLDPNYRSSKFSDTPLEKLLNSKSFEAVKLLVRYGGKIDLSKSWSDGITPMHVAADNGLPEMIKELYIHGFDANAKNRWGVTPLHMAVKHNKHSAISELIRCGADVTIKNNNNETPIDWASNSSPETIKILKNTPISSAETKKRQRGPITEKLPYFEGRFFHWLGQKTPNLRNFSESIETQAMRSAMVVLANLCQFYWIKKANLAFFKDINYQTNVNVQLMLCIFGARIVSLLHEEGIDIDPGELFYSSGALLFRDFESDEFNQTIIGNIISPGVEKFKEIAPNLSRLSKYKEYTELLEKALYSYVTARKNSGQEEESEAKLMDIYGKLWESLKLS